MAATGHRSRPLDSASDVSAGLARLTADPIAIRDGGHLEMDAARCGWLRAEHKQA